MGAGEIARTAGVLAGKTVLVTRAREQSDGLCRELEARGARTVLIPMMRFALPEDTTEMDNAIRGLAQFDWWLLTSQNAVRFAAQRAAALDIELGELGANVKIAAVGPATAAAAETHRVRVDYVAKTHSGAALASELAEKVRGMRVLLLRSELADDSTPALLRELGGDVAEVVGYRVLPPEEQERQKLRAMNWAEVDAGMFFSPAALRLFCECLNPRTRELCDGMTFVAIGATTARAIRAAGFPRLVQAEDTSGTAAVDALEEYWARAESPLDTRVEQL